MKVLGFLCVAVLVAAAAMIGYGIWFEVNDPGHGQITGKTWRQPWTQISCTTVGKTTTCTPIYHPECYEIRYTDGKHDGDACVAPDEYERYEIGGYYPAGAQ